MVKTFEEFINEGQLHKETNCTEEQYAELVAAMKEYGEAFEEYDNEGNIVFELPSKIRMTYGYKEYGEIESDILVAITYNEEYDEICLQGDRVGACLNDEFATCDWDDLVEIIRNEINKL